LSFNIILYDMDLDNIKRAFRELNIDFQNDLYKRLYLIHYRLTY